ncbi:MAG: hypothetical protein CMC76_10230 [Flavobacteriaceae bacterium]|nr:hypothetical protein [Flavobacteriaceae bacterium]|tara:strand:- start:1419 stop:3059 length:1641 start_codon:yes stop_codon:yes gene_type:complete
MKNIIKFLPLLLIALVSCEDTEEFEFLPTEESFEIISPTDGSSLILDETNGQNNALTIVWSDNVSSSENYVIDMSTDEAFTSPINIGSTTANSYSFTVEDLNTYLLQAGLYAYEDSNVYFRVTGGEYSDLFRLSVTSFPDSNPIINNPNDSSDISLSVDTPEDVAMSVEWEDPDFSPSSTTIVNYTVQVALADTEFAEFESLGETQELMLDVTHSGLNNKALSLGLIEETPGSLEVRIFSSLETTSGVIERYSDPITINVTPYASTIEISTWGIVGGAYNNWGAFTDAPFYTTEVPNVLVSYVSLLDGEIKFRENNDWTNNYGDVGADGTLDNGGDNILVTAGNYKVTLDFNENTYTIEPFSWGIVGSGYNDWGATPDAKFYYDYTTNTFKVNVQLLDGEIKFRQNNEWLTDFGDNGSDGTLDAGGTNIAVTAGYYAVTLDFNNNTYTIQSTDVWGIVGSGYNDWGGAGPDFALTQIQPGVYYGDIATLVDGEIKFRPNNDWSTDFGDNGADGTLDAGGTNIAVTAGLYRVKMDVNTGTYELNQIQ